MSSPDYVYVVAESEGAGTDFDWVTIKYRTCPVTFAGDANLDGPVTTADVIVMVNYVFKSGSEPQPCVAAMDVNCDGTPTSADIIYTVNHIFKSGSAPCDVCTLIDGGTWTCP